MDPMDGDLLRDDRSLTQELRRPGIASLDPVGRTAVVAVLVGKGPHDRHPIRQRGHLRQLAAEFDTRKGRFRRAKKTAIFDRDVHLRVERFELRRAAVQEQQDHRALCAASTSAAEARLRNRSGNVRPRSPRLPICRNSRRLVPSHLGCVARVRNRSNTVDVPLN